MERLVKSGPGWRLGWDPEAPAFKGLVGGENWALELTEAELDDFCCLLDQLTAAISTMASELMDEEGIACELESSLIWLEAEGYPQAFSLHLIVNTGRRGEGYWPESVVPGLLEAARVLKAF